MAEYIKLDDLEDPNNDQMNIVDELDEEVLDKISEELVRGFYNDEDTRRDWLMATQDWVKLAMQVSEKKSFPWPNASNTHYPLLATASLQFQARCYPALVPGPDLVNAYVTGIDPQGMAFDRATRIGRHMSYQILYEMENWEEEMDKLCLQVPIVGTVFKKTYYDPLKGYNCSHIVPAAHLVVNYWAKNLKYAPRISHILHFDRNQIKEKENARLWKEIDYGYPVPYFGYDHNKKEVSNRKEPDTDYTTPHAFIEMHTTLDLDGDGYREPWIVTIHLDSKKIVRIVPRFDEEDIHRDGKTIVKIDPVEYFTKFGFIPNPDGSDIYDVGFGLLLGNINHSLDTLINQLTDAGTLNNLQAGFLGRGIRIKGGMVRFQPGEWKQADFTGDDIKKNIFPLPTKEPSDVLFKLFEALLTSGKELASIAEIMVGKMPGQNTPATTTQMSVDQSLKIFTAIYKRLYRSLSEEYTKLYRLNQKNLSDYEQKIYMTLNMGDQQVAPQMPQMQQQQPQPGMDQGQGMPPQQPQMPQQQPIVIAKQDYQDNILVKPNADPNTVSDAQKMTKAQTLLQMAEMGLVNLQEASRQVLEAGKFERIQSLMQPNPTKPDPKMIEMQMKMQIEQQKAQLDQQKAQFDMMVEQQKGKMDIMMKQMEMQLKEKELELKAREANMKMQVTAMQAQQEVQLGQQEHQQNMVHSQQEHQQNMQLSKEQHTSNMQMNKEKMAIAKEKANASRDQQGNVGGMAKKPSNKGS